MTGLFGQQLESFADTRLARRIGGWETSAVRPSGNTHDTRISALTDWRRRESGHLGSPKRLDRRLGLVVCLCYYAVVGHSSPHRSPRLGLIALENVIGQ